jgi:benzylsuccinate CoA-transferase BbsF subunit
MFVGVAGLKSVSGHPGDPPLPWGHQYADFASNPFHAAAAILAALIERERSGEGQFIEVSQYEATVALMGPSVLEYAATGVAPTPRGNDTPWASPHDYYRCAGDSSRDAGIPGGSSGDAGIPGGSSGDAGIPGGSSGDAGAPGEPSGDAWCAIAVETDEQWRALVGATGLAALAAPGFATLEGRQAHRAEIDAAIEGWTSTRDKHEVAETLQAAGVPAGPYQSIVDMVERDPVLAEHFVEIAHPSGRPFLVHANPVQSRRRPPRTARAPLIGEHTYEVLSEVLGLTADEIADYAAQGALE